MHEAPRDEGMMRDRARLRLAVLLALPLVLFLVLFGGFVFGDSLLLYKDIGSDSLNIFYPQFVLRSDYLRQIGFFSWSFQIGMGQNIFPGAAALVITPVIWLPKAAIASALVYQHLLYTLVTAFCFGGFLIRRGLAFAPALLGALLLSFSAYLCMGSCWYFHAYEVVCFSALLFLTELALSTGRWPWLAGGVAVITLLGSFHLYLCALLLCAYVPIRLWERFDGKLGPIARCSIVLGAVAALGLGVAAFTMIGNFLVMLHSPRGGGSASLVRTLSAEPVFGLQQSLYYATAVLRWFGNDLAGTGSGYRGWSNYLEAPMNYCGLICLLVFPQAFCRVTLRERIVRGMVLAFLVLPLVFPWFRYLFWGFVGDYFRTYSLFGVFGLITLSMSALSKYVRGGRLNLWALGLTLLLLLVALLAPISSIQSIIDNQLKWIAALLLVVYAALLALGQILRRPQFAIAAVVMVTASELIYFDSITITRPRLTKHELNERVGYNDMTVDAVRELKAMDPSFFRITKTWGSSPASESSESINDALVFGYYGTASYSSLNNVNYVRFVLSLNDLTGREQASLGRWSTGTLGHVIASTFAAEKYVLTRRPEQFTETGVYELLKHYDSVSLLRNKNFLPLGLTYTSYLTEGDFDGLYPAMRERVLLHAVVLTPEVAAQQAIPQKTLSELFDDPNSPSSEEVISIRRNTALHLTAFQENAFSGDISLERDSVLVLQMAFDPGWRATIDAKSAPTFIADVGLLGIAVPSGHHEIAMHYVPPFRLLGGVVSLVSLAILLFLAWRWPRIQALA